MGGYRVKGVCNKIFMTTTTTDRQTRHSILEKEQKRIVKVSNSTKLEISTRTDYKIVTISYQNQLYSTREPLPIASPGFQEIRNQKFKKTFKKDEIDYEREHLKLERQEKKYKQRDLEKIHSFLNHKPKTIIHELPTTQVKELKSEEIYKLEFGGEPSELVGMATAGEIGAKYGIRGIYFENMVVKLRFKKADTGSVIERIVDGGREKVDGDERDSDSNDPSGTFILPPKPKKKRNSSKINKKIVTELGKSKEPGPLKLKINRSRAFGFPLPVFKKLDLDYSDEHWAILNEKGIF